MCRRIKQVLLPIAGILVLLIALLVVVSQHVQREYQLAANQEIANILGAIAQEDPDVDTVALIRALNRSDPETRAYGQKILASYGYLPDDLVGLSAQDFLTEIVILTIVVVIAFATIVLVYFWYRDWREEYRIAQLVSYLQNLKERIYDLRLEENSEDEFSLLTNEIYKITVLLKEAAENNHLHSQNLETALADISHQLRTPLTSLQITIDNIYDDPEMPLSIRQDFLHSASRQVENMATLVTTLLNIAKFDNGSIKLHSQPFQVGELLEEVRQNLSVLSELDGITLELSGDLTAKIKVDRRWQREAITNIVKNCIEHSPKGSKVVINVADCPLFSTITIQDQGEGIDKADLHHIFERFYKAKNSASDSVGIGLAFAKTVIEADGGRISVCSTTGVGTSFTVTYLKTQ